VLYPLSYEGATLGAYRASSFLMLRSGNPARMTASRKARNEFDRIVGRAKEEFGEATGNARLRDEGRTDQVRARIRKTGERVKDRLRGRRY
jgi:uncharacterized protein YjbJ (UPF0337 family)